MKSQGEMYEECVRVAMKYRGSIVSGVRSEEHNRRVSGHAFSWHRSGDAIDLVFEDKTECERAMIDLALARLHVKPYTKKGTPCLHVQRFPVRDYTGAIGERIWDAGE